MSYQADQVLARDLRAVARAATLVESNSPAAEDLLRELFPHTGNATLIGITGAAGAGKSTLVDRLVCGLRARGQSVAVVAVDPTSPYSGGAILGDRIRMQQHHSDPAVFIRSMATRGHAGGIGAATSDMALLLDAAGYNSVLIETVGVGQDEVEVARTADVTVVVLVPGMGDDVQAMKAGIMEIADIFLINKADLPGVDRLDRELQSALSLAKRPDGWTPSIVHTVATEGTGIDEALSAIDEFRSKGFNRQRTIASWELRLREMLSNKVLASIPDADIRAAAAEVTERRRDPYAVVQAWIEAIERRQNG